MWLSGAASKTRLVLVGSDGQEGLSFPLSEGEHVAGRLEGSIMFPEDRLLSPRHATFLFQAGKLWVRDDGSFNGVFVKLRAPKIVPSGTLLLIGEQLLRVDAVSGSGRDVLLLLAASAGTADDGAVPRRW